MKTSLTRYGVAAAAAVLLSAALGAAPAAAATTPPIAVSAWIGGQYDGGSWSSYANCGAGVLPPEGPEYRCAFEFDLSGLPADSTVTGATLRLLTGQGGSEVDLGGYSGDGAATLADLTAGSVILSFTPSYDTWEDWDVTTFTQGLVAADAGWAGFNLSGEGMPQGWNVVEATLTIVYSMPDPTAPPTSTEPTPSSDSSLILVQLMAMLVLTVTGTRLVTERAKRH